jgi:hypothetical protein
VARRRREIEASGTQVAFVHMSGDAEVRPFFEKAGIGDVSRISDRGKTLYAAFGLAHGSLLRLVGPSVLLRGATAIFSHGVGAPMGDPLQMPGAFVIRDGEIVTAFRHDTIADRPDYVAMAARAS